jgi:hypothetical protein
MPEKRTVERARRAAKAGKPPTTQAGEFVREEMEHVRRRKHGATSRKQVVAIGLSKARRAGVKLPPPKAGTTSPATRRKAERDYERGGKSKPVRARGGRSGRAKAEGGRVGTRTTRRAR